MIDGYLINDLVDLTAVVGWLVNGLVDLTAVIGCLILVVLLI